MYGNNNSDMEDAEAYLHALKTDGIKVPIDQDVHDCVMELPDWYDETLFKRAQEFYSRNLFAMFTGKLYGLLAGLALPNILKTLMYTNKSSTPYTAYKRYLGTIFHTISWYENDLKPGSRSWRSLEIVRRGHSFASKHAMKGNIGFISQYDLALAQFGFMGYIMATPHRLGIQVDCKDFDGFIHFWRVIGHMLGVQDKYNLCTDSYHTTKPRLDLVLNQIYRPCLEETSDDFATMTKALVEGLWCFSPYIDTDAVVFCTKWLSNCKNYIYFESEQCAIMCDLSASRKIVQSFNWYTRFILFLEITTQTYLLNFAAFQWFFNFQIWISQYIIYWFPFLAFYKFGFSRSFVRILKDNN